MKKILSGTALLLVIAFVAFAQEKKEKEEAKLSYREVGSVLPPLRIIDTTRKEYTEKNFRNNNHFFVFLFNPTCGHCIQMAKLMGDHIREFRKNHILFMAGPAMMSYLPSFYQASGVGKHPEIVVGIDSASAVDRLYEYRMLPQINIYNKERRLEKTFYGDTPLDSLKQYLP